MSIPDTLMWDWALLLTDQDAAEIERRKRALAAGEIHPKTLKQELARTLVAQFHGPAAADQAREEFERIFAGGGAPEDAPEIAVAAGVALQKALVDGKLAPSGNEARRLVQQGAVTLDGERVSDPALVLAARDEPYLVKVGKRRFAKLRVR
jgi:tyrosyl-tRNA synthetase